MYKEPRSPDCDEDTPCSSLREFQEIYSTPTKLWDLAGIIAIDVNGVKNPNIAGRDVFVFMLGNDGALYPYGGIDDAVREGCDYANLLECDDYWVNGTNRHVDCGVNSSEPGWGCAANIIENNWRMTY